MIKRSLAYILFLSFVGCSGLEQSEQEKMRQRNAKGEFIYRNHDEINYRIPVPKHRIREKYPWEDSYIGSIRKITKEFFRCKGSMANPPTPNPQDNTRLLTDCGGMEKHSLPLRNDKEFIYPVLIDLLNYVQIKTNRKVIVTCGYRCPLHNTYADPTPFNQTSKHTIGAEVDFYVQGLESRPEEVVKIIMNFYKENSRYQKKEYLDFQRYEKGDTNVSVLPWYNKEVMIKLYQKNEGRDLDNRHPYPYISIQVRHDRDLNEKVVYSWPKANSCFRRY